MLHVVTVARFLYAQRRKPNGRLPLEKTERWKSKKDGKVKDGSLTHSRRMDYKIDGAWGNEASPFL